MTETEEKWAPVRDLEQWLEVSDQGRVRSLLCSVPHGKSFRRAGGRIAPQWIGRGYWQTSFMRGGVRYRFRVHQAIAHAFVPGYFPGATVDHIDGNRLNNAVSNLRWLTRSENTKCMWADGRGGGVDGAKLTDDAAEEICKLRAGGMTLRAIGEQFGLCEAAVCRFLKGRRRARQMAPFIEKYRTAM